MMEIGKNIKKFRTARGFTQVMMAGLVGVSAQAVSKWECEECIP